MRFRLPLTFFVWLSTLHPGCSPFAESDEVTRYHFDRSMNGLVEFTLTNGLLSSESP